MPRRLLALACLALALGACRSTRVEIPVVPPTPVIETGRASFFFPVQIPLSQVRRALEEAIPRRLRGGAGSGSHLWAGGGFVPV